MLDIGLISVQLGLASASASEVNNRIFSNKGRLAEQFVGQQLRAAQSPLTDPHLFYWQRTGGRLAEAEKGHDLAVRCDINPPSIERIDMKTTVGRPASYRVLSIPVYLAERIADFIDQMQDHPS